MSPTKPYVIAEIGSNHNGSVQNAMKLIDMADLAGADAVKFQKRANRTLYTDEFFKKPYDGYGPTYGAHREALEFGITEFETLKQYAEFKVIDFFVTPFDIPSVEFLEHLGVTKYKVASAHVTNHLLIEKIIETGKPIIMSVGGQSIESIMRTNALFPVYYDLTILHCVAAYPCPPHMMNLGRIRDLQQVLPNRKIGLSDHQDGIALGAAAYALGARVFEKHITLDHNAKGTDHRFSLEFYGLQQYIKYLNQTANAMIWNEQPMLAEIAPIQKMAHSLYWGCDIPAGQKIEEHHIAIQSPAHKSGLQPTGYNVRKFVGRTLLRSVKKGDILTQGDLK
jgi:sialic acid synthase SpsE